MTAISRQLLVLAALLLATPAHAQGYPERPIRLIVPIAAGSVTDVIMRAAANELAPRLGPRASGSHGAAPRLPGAAGRRAPTATRSSSSITRPCRSIR